MNTKMKEKIKELAKKSNLYFYPSSNCGPLHVEHITPGLETFAELIILECIKIANDTSVDDSVLNNLIDFWGLE